MQLSPEQIAALAALANGIIPADHTDGGAAAVNAGSRLAEKIRFGTNALLYGQGLETAGAMAKEMFGCEVSRLDADRIHQLLGALRVARPQFFKQLRMDVSAIYLTEPAVWERIGFPGPSASSGGYPDFDQPQTRVNG